MIVPTLRLGLGLRFPGPGPAVVTAPPVGPFAPTDLSGLLLWFDAADASSITLSSGSSVAQWNDKSGHSNHAVQATGARQPVLETAAQNGKNLLAFTNTAAQSFFSLSSRVSLGAASTLVAVVRAGTLGGSPLINVFGDSVNPIDFPFEWFSDGIIYVNGPTNYIQSTAKTLSGCHTLIIPTGRVLFDSVDISDVANAGPGSGSGFIDTIGNGDNSNFTQGEMAELMAFNRVLNSTEIAQVQSYLKTKWGTP